MFGLVRNTVLPLFWGEYPYTLLHPCREIHLPHIPLRSQNKASRCHCIARSSGKQSLLLCMYLPYLNMWNQNQYKLRPYGILTHSHCIPFQLRDRVNYFPNTGRRLRKGNPFYRTSIRCRYTHFLQPTCICRALKYSKQIAQQGRP